MDGSQIEVGGPSEGHCGLIKWYVVVLKVRSVDPQRDTVGLSSGLWTVLKVRLGDPQRDRTTNTQVVRGGSQSEMGLNRYID